MGGLPDHTQLRSYKKEPWLGAGPEGCPGPHSQDGWVVEDRGWGRDDAIQGRDSLGP